MSVAPRAASGPPVAATAAPDSVWRLDLDTRGLFLPKKSNLNQILNVQMARRPVISYYHDTIYLRLLKKINRLLKRGILIDSNWIS